MKIIRNRAFSLIELIVVIAILRDKIEYHNKNGEYGTKSELDYAPDLATSGCSSCTPPSILGTNNAACVDALAIENPGLPASCTQQ